MDILDDLTDDVKLLPLSTYINLRSFLIVEELLGRAGRWKDFDTSPLDESYREKIWDISTEGWLTPPVEWARAFGEYALMWMLSNAPLWWKETKE